MRIAEKIREMIGRRRLKHYLKKSRRQPRATGYSSATSVGILYIVDHATHEPVRNLVKRLHEDGIRKIKALGYCPGKEVPSSYLIKLNFDYYSGKDLNSINIPLGHTVKNFVLEPYDILIDLCDAHPVGVDYVLAKSRATFKVGRYNKDREAYYDMMIRLKDKEGMPVLIKEINHYLAALNKNSHAGPI